MFVSMLLVGCRTAKQPVAVVEPEVRITRSELETMEAFKPVGDAFTAKVKINADISGTEAAAAVYTGENALEGAVKRFEFKATRPFFYAIKEKSTNAILFMGKVTNPKE